MATVFRPMFVQVGLNKMVNLQYCPMCPDCTVFYCLSLALWKKFVIGIFCAIFIILVVVGICRFCQKRRKCKQKRQVETEFNEKDKEGNSDDRRHWDNTRPSKPMFPYDIGV